MKLYITDISQTSINHLRGLVDSVRIEKSRQYRHESDQLRSLAAGALLNYAVKENFPKQSIPVTPATDEFRKPHLDFTEFSLTHSGSYAACALCENPVGIDIEHVRAYRPAIAKRFFTPEESDACVDADTFTVCWTLKESFLKATGYGIRLPMDSFEIRPFSFTVKPNAPADYEYTHSIDARRYFGRTYVINPQNYLSVCSADNNGFPDSIHWVSL